MHEILFWMEQQSQRRLHRSWVRVCTGGTIPGQIMDLEVDPDKELVQLRLLISSFCLLEYESLSNIKYYNGRMKSQKFVVWLFLKMVMLVSTYDWCMCNRCERWSEGGNGGRCKKSTKTRDTPLLLVYRE